MYHKKMTQIYKNYLDVLNAPQQRAVMNTEGNYLVLAGAGSGKTKVLTNRLLHILLQKKALPHQILAVTFTNKAALEMKSRVLDMLKMPIDNIWLGTFHSLSVKILRSNAKLVGLKSNFIIIEKIVHILEAFFNKDKDLGKILQANSDLMSEFKIKINLKSKTVAIKNKKIKIASLNREYLWEKLIPILSN